MDLRHSFSVPAGVDQVWATFMDLEEVGGCFPGATVTSVSDDGFAGTVKVKLGPIALQYSGSGRFVERDDATHRAVIEAKGKDKRGNGTAGATVTIALEPDGHGTAVDVTTDLAVTGKPAQFGRGVMQDVSDKLLGQFVSCLERRLGPDANTDDSAPLASAPSVAAATDPVTTVAADDAAGASAPVPAPAPAAPPPAVRPAPRAAPDADDSLDLGATVLPVLARTYGGHLAAGVAGLLVGWLVGRRGS